MDGVVVVIYYRLGFVFDGKTLYIRNATAHDKFSTSASYKEFNRKRNKAQAGYMKNYRARMAAFKKRGRF